MNARLDLPPHPALADRYGAVRSQSLALAAPLSEADCQVQSMPDASPVKWHLAHTTWFFETFVLAAHVAGHRPFDPAFKVLFNSYYNGVGAQHPRAQRGLVTRPDLATVRAWRAAVDEQMATLLSLPLPPGVAALVELGLQHEQQHQELVLTDVLHLLSCNPLAPLYLPLPAAPVPAGPAAPLRWIGQPGGLVEIGDAAGGFAFDNEQPRHAQHLRPHALASRPVSQGDWTAFIADGGYADPRWWMSAGWDWVRQQQVAAPLHWRRGGPGPFDWQVFSLRGLQPLQAGAPVCHVSWFEADAFARWHAAQHPDSPPSRLPTEAEWEAAAQAAWPQAVASGNLLESGALRPLPAADTGDGLQQLAGDVWEWTASPYTAYPGYRPWTGAVGEYNGKFMVNQMVLRGGSCATPRSHLRPSYRNFFPTDARWQFSGVRLARDCN
ncbi:ergothioneine biosynthesis protein EgtB [Pseudaquabacterium pictum]|uniref:Ergothioneine biosynthesis protein EgtB n=1 Tax=Pseudaquabacterium pictum TaxID=2315236 RepID=A0A480ASU9_9BURK|nr:ergothioneine biosynthesis protein EgtB [Rubrivivax pictus]GCL63307.1 ergothioneine biosynthesis protein EgtB [Rubrivivax pictus]